MSAHEINTRLIIVEGLPGSGKSTTAAMVAVELEARGRNVVCVDEGAVDHPADVGDYNFPDFASERATMLDKWRAFAAHAEPDTTHVFNCVLLQNPMCETMMRFGMSEDESQQYINDIATIIAPLRPVVIYIDAPDAKTAVDGVLDERGDGWLNAVINYHTSQGYGKAHGLCGYEGYIACLEERRDRELRILRSLSMDSHIIAPLSDAERISALVDSIG
ncbi:zeta toxin family protein [Bifidobacterium pseudolongum]|nr:zeta toxin family protein [Bifidobacterium pseudolongum]